MRKGFTRHDIALLRIIADDHRSQRFVVKKQNLGTVGENLDRIADALEAVAKAAAAPVDPTAGLAKLLDVVFNGRPA